jgi:hypothetical protein
MHMLRIWRKAVPIALAGGLIGASGAVPAKAASSPPSVSISVTSPHFPTAVHGKVVGYALVAFRGYRGFPGSNVATVSGKVTGAATGDTLTLLADPFGGKGFAATGTPVTLTGSSATYSFHVAPFVATRYKVALADGTVTDAVSAVQTVYVTEGGGDYGGHGSCSRDHCTFVEPLAVWLPASAIRNEKAKHVYVYFAFDPKIFNRHPVFPRYLDRWPATVSKPRVLSATDYQITITIHFTSAVPHAAEYGIWTSCTRDTESKDGIGLPGHHHCGQRQVTWAEGNSYLG